MLQNFYLIRPVCLLSPWRSNFSDRSTLHVSRWKFRRRGRCRRRSKSKFFQFDQISFRIFYVLYRMETLFRKCLHGSDGGVEKCRMVNTGWEEEKSVYLWRWRLQGRTRRVTFFLFYKEAIFKLKDRRFIWFRQTRAFSHPLSNVQNIVRRNTEVSEAFHETLPIYQLFENNYTFETDRLFPFLIVSR